MSFLLSVIILLLIIGEAGISFWLPKEHMQETTSQLADLMPNDTILLYQGNSSSITISEVLPASRPKHDVSLFVTECTDLIKHTKNHTLTDLPLNFTIISPVFIPSSPLHYELGSTISFAITTIDATEDSMLDLFMFDNATKAIEYSHNPNPETGAQAISHWSIDTKEDNSTHITFIPPYGSYFIPVLSPVPNPILDIELSYMIKQVFYFHGDYTQYTNCSLDEERCSLHFSAGNLSCVLAYTPLSSKEVTLQTYSVTGEKELASDHLLLSRFLIGGIALPPIVALAICILVYKCIQKKHKRPNGYISLPQVPRT